MVSFKCTNMQFEWDQCVSKEASITLCQHPYLSHNIFSIFIKTFSKKFVKSYVYKKITIPQKWFQPIVYPFTCWKTVKHTLWFWPSPAGRYMFLHMEWQCHKTIKKLTADPLFPILRLWFYSHYYMDHSFWLDSRGSGGD